MKKYTYILMVLCLALQSCGMTDVWKDWENEGTMSESRLKPSEVKKVLCAEGIWKMTYQGTVFYYQFSESGTVASVPDETLFQKEEVESDYYLDYEGEKKILLTVSGDGALQYLAEGKEETFVITDYSSQKITATGSTNGLSMVLTPATATELAQNKADREAAVIAYNKAQAVVLLKSELNNGVFRNSSSEFMAHYLMACSGDNQWSLKVSAIVDGVVKHTEVAMTIDTSNDVKAVLTLDKALTIGGVTLSYFDYNYSTGALGINNASVTCDTKKASEIVEWYTGGSWKTHAVDQDEIHADFKGIFHSGVEFDDRTPRNMIACPWSGMGSYISFNPTVTADDETGRVFITLGSPFDLFGWNNNPADYALVEKDYEKLLTFCGSSDGFYWTYDDNNNVVYVLSATGEQWFRMKK